MIYWIIIICWIILLYYMKGKALNFNLQAALYLFLVGAFLSIVNKQAAETVLRLSFVGWMTALFLLLKKINV